MPYPTKISGGVCRKGQRHLIPRVHRVHPQLLSRTGDGEAFFVQQSLDANEGLDILATVHALSGAALDRLQLRKLRFPETQNVRRQLAKGRNFADPKIKFFRNDDFVLRCKFGFRFRLIAHPDPVKKSLTLTAFLARYRVWNNSGQLKNLSRESVREALQKP